MNTPKDSPAERTPGSLHPVVRRYGPWICKQRPVGDWVVDQIDRETMRVRRYGPYPTEAEARGVYADLAEVSPNVALSGSARENPKS